MANKQVRVSPKLSGWRRVHKAWGAKDSIHTQTQAEAIEKAKQIAQNQSTELIVQRKDWTIRQRDSYWRDPFPPRG